MSSSAVYIAIQYGYKKIVLRLSWLIAILVSAPRSMSQLLMDMHALSALILHIAIIWSHLSRQKVGRHELEVVTCIKTSSFLAAQKEDVPVKPRKAKSKRKGSIADSWAVLKSSPKILNLALLVVSYGVSHRLFEFAWKGQLGVLYPSAQQYQVSALLSPSPPFQVSLGLQALRQGEHVGTAG